MTEYSELETTELVNKSEVKSDVQGNGLELSIPRLGTAWNQGNHLNDSLPDFRPGVDQNQQIISMGTEWKHIFSVGNMFFCETVTAGNITFWSQEIHKTYRHSIFLFHLESGHLQTWFCFVLSSFCTRWYRDPKWTRSRNICHQSKNEKKAKW